jgi:hypothetical protein
MIDWYAKVVELKRIADELEHWAMRMEGRGRLVLGRSADELRQFAGEIEQLLDAEQVPPPPPEPLPDWLTAIFPLEDGSDTPQEWPSEERTAPAGYWEATGGEQANDDVPPTDEG